MKKSDKKISEWFGDGPAVEVIPFGYVVIQAGKIIHSDENPHLCNAYIMRNGLQGCKVKPA